MKRLIAISLIFALTATISAQTSRRTPQKKATTTATRKTTTSTGKQSKTSNKKKTTTRTTANKKKTTTYSNASIKDLEKKRNQLQKNIKQQEKALQANKSDVKKRLNTLLTINSEINKHQKNISEIENDINKLNGDIDLLKAQLGTLNKQLADRKSKYIKSMRYISRNHTVQDKLMFIFSAESLTQMYRRLRFVREYAAYQRTQGELIKSKQMQVDTKHRQLEGVKNHKNTLLNKGVQERKALEGQQSEQQKVVKNLQKQQKTIQQIISQQRKESASLNARIDQLIAEEVAKAQARAAAEAKRKQEAEARRRKEAELARQKAAAEKERLANEQRIREAREREKKLKEMARKASESDNSTVRERTAQEAREAEAERKAIERKAEAADRRNRSEIEKTRKSTEEHMTMSSVDRKLSGSFESNRGRLPMPVTGSYRIVSHFGQNKVEGLKGVTIDNKGINILGTSGCMARSIYDGEVSAVFGFSGSMVVMVRHGIYISVYCNLSSVSVSRGQKVSTRQALGRVASDNILQFQLRRNMDKLNPESWLGR